MPVSIAIDINQIGISYVVRNDKDVSPVTPNVEIIAINTVMGTLATHEKH